MTYSPYGEINELDDEEKKRLLAEQDQLTQMDAAVAQADQKRAEQQSQYEENINKGDPAAQL